MFRLLGDDSVRAAANANTVMAIETELARASRKLEDLRDPIKNYNAMALAGVDKLTPSIALESAPRGGQDRPHRFRDRRPAGVLPAGREIVARALDRQLEDLPALAARARLRGRRGRRLRQAENFHFYGTILNGTAEQRPRWKRVLDSEENYLGDALGQLYVAKYFSPRTKQRYEKLTDEIFAAFRARITKLAWMSAPTKQRALKKLNSVIKKVGYPERVEDLLGLRRSIGRRRWGTRCAGNMWQNDDAIAKLHKPVDRPSGR